MNFAIKQGIASLQIILYHVAITFIEVVGSDPYVAFVKNIFVDPKSHAYFLSFFLDRYEV
jgi:hypothetical protein